MIFLTHHYNVFEYSVTQICTLHMYVYIHEKVLYNTSTIITLVAILTADVLLGLTVMFTQNQYIGSEADGFIAVNLEVVGGTFVNPFSVSVTPSEHSPVSAEGNNVMSIIICVEWRVFD